MDAIKADTEALEKAFYPLAEKLYREAGAQGGDPTQGPTDDGVYDADFDDNGDDK